MDGRGRRKQRTGVTQLPDPIDGRMAADTRSENR